jgi:phosphoribosylaminoimidazole (AIR) synthetase
MTMHIRGVVLENNGSDQFCFSAGPVLSEFWMILSLSSWGFHHDGHSLIRVTIKYSLIRWSQLVSK